MSEQQPSINQDGLSASQSIAMQADRPVVGVIATPTNGGDVASTILRAQAEGFDTIVCHGGDSSLEAVAFAERLGMPVVEVDEDHQGTPGFTTDIARAARKFGYPGVFFHTELGCPVDFEASLAQIHETESYLIDAIPKANVRADTNVLVAIPAYNEESAIGEVVTNSLPYADEVLVIDDGSSDRTVEFAAAAGATVVQHTTNKGYGGALKTAFVEAARAHADHLVILDADGQHNPADIPRLLHKQRESGSAIVIGSRFAQGASTDMPVYRRVGLGVVNLLTNLSMGVVRKESRVSDTQSGFRAYNKDAIEMLATNRVGESMGASTDILNLAHRHNFRMDEVGIHISYDVENGSSMDPLSHGMELVSNLLQTIERERPVSALGIPGLLALVVGIALMYMTFSNYIGSGTFPLGMAILSVLFGLAGILSTLTAIVLHSLNTHLNVS